MTLRTVGIDVRMMRASGIGTYLQGLLRGISRKPTAGMAFQLITAAAEPMTWPWPSQPVTAGIYTMAEQFQIPRAFRQSSADLLHCPHYNAPVGMIKRCAVTVHDLIHL